MCCFTDTGVVPSLLGVRWHTPQANAALFLVNERLILGSATNGARLYTRSPLEDSRLFGPSPWKILAATNEKDISEQPSPWRKSSKRESCYGDWVYSW